MKQLLDIISSLCVEHSLWSQHAICLYLSILRERTRGFKPYTDEKRDTRLPSNFPKFTHLAEPELKCKPSDTKSPDKRQWSCVCRRGVLERQGGRMSGTMVELYLHSVLGAVPSPITSLSKWLERGTLNRQEGFVETEGCMLLLEKQMHRTPYNTAVGLYANSHFL